MTQMETVLLCVLVAFPLLDLVLEKYRLSTKIKEYVKTAVMLWLVTGLLIYCYDIQALSVTTLPAYLTGGIKGYIASGLLAIFCVYTLYIIRVIKNNNSVRESIQQTFVQGGEAMQAILPQTDKEYLVFVLVVSVSAAICEELIFRWYLYSFISQHYHWLFALIISSVGFGLWHLYLGWQHVLKTSVIGAFLCAVYLVFDDILVAIAMHLAMDVYAGTIAYSVYKYSR